MQHDAPTESEANRLDRRQAMKAALGGAAAAAVFTAPRIEGFSTAPHYASAVTVPACVDKNGNGTLTRNNTNGCAGGYRCWGGTSGVGGCGGCNNAAALAPASITVTPNPEVPPYTVPTLSGTVTGQLIAGGNYSLTLNGYTDGAQWNRCVVTVGGNCSSGTFTANPSSITRNSNGAFNGTLQCVNGSGFPNGTVNVNIACFCTGN